MKDTITNAAEITILQPIDNNYKTGGGDISVGGAVVAATKGKPFTPTRIYGGTTDIEDNFGKPLPSKMSGMEGLRHVHDASESCSYVNVVRVVNALTYRFPSMAFLAFRELDKRELARSIWKLIRLDDEEFERVFPPQKLKEAEAAEAQAVADGEEGEF